MKCVACSLLLTLVLVFAAGPTRADSDQDRARAAVQAGHVLPLRSVLERLERQYPGQVLEVELEQDGGRWVYEVKLLQAGGRLIRLDVDAGTGEILKYRVRKRPN